MAEISAGMPQNETSSRPNKTHSTFPLSYKNLLTCRFGEITPHFVIDGVEDDSLPLRSSHELRSYTLGAPLMEDIKIHKDYFMVPMEAILPLNWDKFYRNPVQGDDVIASEVGPTIDVFDLSAATESTTGLFKVPWNDSTFCLSWYFSILPVLESLYSKGSLLHVLGYKGLADAFVYNRTENGVSLTRGFDEFYQDFLAEIARTYSSFSVVIDSTPYTVCPNIIDGNTPKVSSNVLNLREFLELLRDDCRVSFSAFTKISGHTSTLSTIISSVVSQTFSAWPRLNLSRLWAYQMICAHYYTNDQVDYVYTAELFRQYIYNCLELASTIPGSNLDGSVPGTFTYNGLTCQYDFLSAHYAKMAVADFCDTYNTNQIGSTQDVVDYLHPVLPYMQALFSFNRSLRFVDYFTGVRSHPLAVVGNGISVSGPFTDVIDVTKKIQVQRFLNAVNRNVHKFSDQLAGYVKGLFGINQAPDYHNPFYLASSVSNVFTQENENTADAQYNQSYSITSVLRAQDSRFAFDFHPDRRCIIMGMTWFDIPRAYAHSIDKHFLHVNRYDMFNTYLQYTGDVALPAECRNLMQTYNTSNVGQTFGYQTPYMEYKQRFNQASGGFVDGSLPGWAFIADEGARNVLVQHITPDYIRSSATELDKFYLMLTGFTLSNYFHFAIAFNNEMDATRPMAYDPQIVM